MAARAVAAVAAVAVATCGALLFAGVAGATTTGGGTSVTMNVPVAALQAKLISTPGNGWSAVAVGSVPGMPTHLGPDPDALAEWKTATGSESLVDIVFAQPVSPGAALQAEVAASVATVCGARDPQLATSSTPVTGSVAITCAPAAPSTPIVVGLAASNGQQVVLLVAEGSGALTPATLVPPMAAQLRRLSGSGGLNPLLVGVLVVVAAGAAAGGVLLWRRKEATRHASAVPPAPGFAPSGGIGAGGAVFGARSPWAAMGPPASAGAPAGSSPPGGYGAPGGFSYGAPSTSPHAKGQYLTSPGAPTYPAPAPAPESGDPASSRFQVPAPGSYPPEQLQAPQPGPYPAASHPPVPQPAMPYSGSAAGQSPGGGQYAPATNGFFAAQPSPVPQQDPAYGQGAPPAPSWVEDPGGGAAASTAVPWDRGAYEDEVPPGDGYGPLPPRPGMRK